MNALRPGAIKSRTCAAFFHDKFLWFWANNVYYSSHITILENAVGLSGKVVHLVKIKWRLLPDLSFKIWKKKTH